MFNCVVNSWVLLLFVAHQGFPLIYGQNLALGGQTKQSSTHGGSTSPYGSTKAVDGDKSGDFFNSNSCTHTYDWDYRPNLSLTFTKPVTITKIILYNRLNSYFVMLRLQGFILRGFSRNNSQLFTHTDKNPVAQPFYTVQLDKPVSGVAMVNVEATRIEADGKKILTLCELEVFGDPMDANLLQCETGWFGLECRFKCHCSDNNCTTEGLCANGSKCVSGWFGPACQYADELTSDTFVKDNPKLARLFDGDESTCLDQGTTKITLTWTRPILITWLRAQGKDVQSLRDLNFRFKVHLSSPSTQCTNRRETKVSETTMDVHCDMDDTTTQVIITGPGVSSLCSLYISGGRNLALRGNTKQSSTIYRENNSTVSANAVDGEKNGYYGKGVCSCTDPEDQQPHLNLTFTNPVTITKFILYNKIDGISTVLWPRLSEFILKGFSRDNRELLTFTESEPSALPVYTVLLDKPVSDVALVNVEATSTATDGFKILNLCELEVFGDCPKEWFGSLCQFKCHCTGGGCDVYDGHCAEGDKCQRGWFGPACQYSDLAITAERNVDLAILTDGDEKTCLNSPTNNVTVTWTIPYQFTWFRVHARDLKSLQNVIVQFTNGTKSVIANCTNRREARISETAIDIYCDMSVTAKQVTLTGQGVQSLCSLYISGGRNVALKQSTSQSSSNPAQLVNSQSSNAVDGSTNGAISSGSCSHTADADPRPQWNVTLSSEVAINRYVIYNRKEVPALTKRLQGFILASYSRNGQQTFEFTDKSGEGQEIYEITTAAGENNTALTSITATYGTPDRRYLHICEVEIYGDSVCEPWLFGRECEKRCRCAVTTENCFVSTGGCPSGCAPGFSGEGCQ